MTFYHLANCLALACGPYILTYKHFELSEYGAFWKIIQLAGLYLMTELCKMLLLATLFPADFVSDPSVLSAFLHCTVDLGDIIGLSLVMKNISASGVTKVLIAGLGWATGDFFLSGALPLWAGARGLQFDWQYLAMSLEANVVLVGHLCLAALCMLWQRAPSPLVTSLAVGATYTPLLPALAQAAIGNPPQVLLLALNAIPTVAIATASFTLLHREL